MFNEDQSFFSRLKSLFGGHAEEKSSDVIPTRRVVGFNEEEVPRPTSFEDIVNNPLPASTPVGVRTVEPTAQNYETPTEENLDILFAEKYTEQGGCFIYCQTLAEVIEILQKMKSDQSWAHIFAWENEIKDLFCEHNFQRGALGFNITNSDAVISLCESLVAEDGSIIFNPKQASRRTLDGFPKTHIVLADATRLTPSLASGLNRFHQLHKPELPSVFKLDDHSNEHFYNKNKLVLRAEGTREVIVIFVDELIPPSLKP
ncbi:MAG: LUD domain-containing protein [Chitinophagales bacterium]|nr:lactate utilization protein [Chitinophagales bacterium]MDW8273088.1 LUD domain-containing protein [Chitinophagales bacterium]